MYFFINTEIKSEEISESQTNDQKNHSHVSPKHQESQVETEKEGTMMAEGKLGQWDDSHKRNKRIVCEL